MSSVVDCLEARESLRVQPSTFPNPEDEKSVMKSSLDLVQLLAEAKDFEFWLDGSGAYMAMKPAAGVPPLRDGLRAAVNEIATFRGKKPLNVMLNILPPGTKVPEHTDTVPGLPERWHLPLATNRKCIFWSEISGETHYPLGIWSGPVPYNKLHTVWNLGTTERVHLVVDLES